jgi:hypothetical protein
MGPLTLGRDWSRGEPQAATLQMFWELQVSLGCTMGRHSQWPSAERGLGVVWTEEEETAEQAKRGRKLRSSATEGTSRMFPFTGSNCYPVKRHGDCEYITHPTLSEERSLSSPSTKLFGRKL